jgi:DNA polymerase (family 10)
VTNKEIAQLFRNVAASYSIKNEAKFRFQLLAYQKAADSIDGLTVQISDLYKEDKLPMIPGVGPTLQMRLDELMKTGKVKHFEEVMKDIPRPVFVLMQIPSIGPKKAYRISEHFKLKNPKTAVSDVEKLAKTGKIAGLEGFGEKSEKDILRAVEEFKQGKGKTTRMLLPYATDVADQVLEYLKDSKYVVKAETLGSLRRSMPTVGDIDIAVATNNPNETLEYFTAYPRKERIIEKGTATSSLLVSGGHQVDLMVVAPDQFGSLLQHFTGSKNHNVHLRENALKNGLSLNEKGIKNLKTEKLAKFDSEEKFYNALGMDWVPPEMREDTGEIELALKHQLPKIVELEDIKGDFHIHSSFQLEPSHDLGRNSISEMLDKAKSLGYEYLGFSEHNPRTSRHTKREIVDLVRARNEAIEEQNDLHGVKTFRLMETDILPDGTLALPDEALELLDASIVSIHSVFSMNKEDMTKRVLSGLSHPKAKILAHPRGRLLNERNGYELDWEKILEFCKENNKALEINAYPNRLDLSGEIIRLAVEAGVKMPIDTDSHASSQMEMMRYGVAQARRGWATKSDIINTQSFEEVKNFFNS